MFEYLVSDEELYVSKKSKEQLAGYIKQIDEYVLSDDFKSLDKYEEQLLKEYVAVKLRIDLIRAESNTDPKEMKNLRLYLTALNQALFYIIEVNPDSNLGKHWNKKK